MMTVPASPTQRRHRFRALLEDAVCRIPASVYDPISARMAEDLGFQAGMLSGSVAALAVLGAPDPALLRGEEFALQARRIVRATRILPLLADAERGSNGGAATMRSVEELEAAGAAAVVLEDVIPPRLWSQHKPPHLLPREEAAGRIRAALAARQDPSLVIVARCAALELGALGEATARAHAYATAGADALCLTGASTLEQVRVIAEAAGLPLLLAGGRDDWTGAELAASGVRLAIGGHQPFLAAVRAVSETLTDLRDGTPPDALANQANATLLRQVSRADEYEAAVAAYLGTR